MKLKTVNILLVGVFSTLSIGSFAKVNSGKVKLNKEAIPAEEKITKARSALISEPQHKKLCNS